MAAGSKKNMLQSSKSQLKQHTHLQGSNMKVVEPKFIKSVRNELGESPVWNPNDNSLYWTDIQEKKLYSFSLSDEICRQWSLPERLGSFSFRKGGGIIGAFETGFATFNLDSNELNWLSRPLELGNGVRFNDGKTDPFGRFLAGTMDENCKDFSGALWGISEKHEMHKLIESVCISNSLAWSPDGRTMYFSDSTKKVIEKFEYDPATGTLGEQGIHIDFTNQPGVPDGSAIDSKGGLWTAFYGGGQIIRTTSDGVIDEIIKLPVSQPTCCAFGGPDLDILFVTTAAQNLSREEIINKPLSGLVLRIDVNETGLNPSISYL